MQTQKRFELALSVFAGLALLLGSAGAIWGAYVGNGDGTVTDSATGLMWQQADDGLSRTWQNALSYCEALDLAGQTDWRLPDIRELQSIVDDGRHPAINPDFICLNDVYWSGSSFLSIPSLARVVTFGGGYSCGGYFKSDSHYVRCVRGGARVSVVNSTKEPSSNLITRLDSGQLKFFSQTGVYLDKPTVVITHGWNRSGSNEIPEWITEMSQAIIDKGVDANILWWDWLDQASSPTPASSGRAATNAPDQGRELGEALFTTFGQSYNHPIHFIGHSMGARVNRRAVDELHLKGWDVSTKTHVTILDAAEYGDLDLNPWDKCIPDNAVFWIDNYITAFGDLHTEAANVILRQNMPLTIFPPLVEIFDSWKEFHGYAVQWYIESIKAPFPITQMGFRWSFEGGGLNGSPAIGSVFAQTLSRYDSEFILETIEWPDAKSIMNEKNSFFSPKTLILGYDSIRGAVEATSNVVTGITTKIENNLIKYSIFLILTETSPSYAWVPIYIPQDTEFLSFNFRVEQSGDGDYLSVGIQNELLFMLDIENSNVLQAANSGYLNVSAYAGSEVELFFGLNNVGSANSKINIEGITFHSRLYGDTEKDGDVDGTDLSKMIFSFGSIAGQNNYHALRDLNGNGVVDSYDIPKFAENFGYVK